MNKGHNRQSEKGTHGLEENIHKSCVQLGLILRIYKEFLQLNNKVNNSIKNWVKRLRRFSTEEI